MGDIAYDRCPNDDWKSGSAMIGVNPETGQPIELDINGVGAVVGIHAALLSLSVAMKAGYEEDFLEKVALALSSKVDCDPHALCPLLTTLTMCLALVSKVGDITFDKEGHIAIRLPDDFGPCSGPECMYDPHGEDEEDDDELHEPPVDRDGAGEGGAGTGDSGDGINPD